MYRKIVRLSLSGISLVALAVSGRTFADDATAQPIIVTASRVAQPEDQALASVTVITRADIVRSQASDMVELLRSVAGIDLARTGGPGGQTSLFLRGANSNHVLVLIDGVRAADATTGGFAWENLDPSQIDHIEIVRGPRATLYGSDAIGGVIQIFTRKPKGPTAEVDGGSFRTHGAEAGIGVGDKVRFYANASYHGAAGFSATNPSAGPFLYSPDNDGYQQHSITAGLESPLGANGSLALNAWDSYLYTQFDPGADYSRGQNRVVNLRLKEATTANWVQTLSLGNAMVDLATYGDYPTQITTHRNSVDWQHDLSLDNKNLLSLGYSFVNDAGDSIDNTANAVLFDDSIHDNAVFADLLSRIGSQQLQLGVREDRHSRFGDHGTGQVGWGWDMTPAWRWIASYGTAFRAPNLNELFSPGYGGLFAGNPNLQPETSHSTEFGAIYRPSATQRLRASVYYTAVRNLIDFSGLNFQAVNVDRASMRGLELAYRWQQEPWRFNANATLQKAMNDVTDELLQRRPERKLSMTLDRAVTRHVSVGTELIAASNHADYDNISGNTVTIPGYAVVNLFGAYALSQSWSIGGRLENLLNKQYQLVSGYNTPSRSVFVTLRYAPPS